MHCGDRVGSLGHRVKQFRRRGGSDSRKQSRHAKSGHPATWILSPAQHAQHILNMGRFQELESSVLDERDTSPSQFQLELRAMAGAAKQYSLRSQGDAGLSIFEHGFRRVTCLVGLITNRNKLRLL